MKLQFSHVVGLAALAGALAAFYPIGLAVLGLLAGFCYLLAGNAGKGLLVAAALGGIALMSSSISNHSALEALAEAASWSEDPSAPAAAHTSPAATHNQHFMATLAAQYERQQER